MKVDFGTGPRLIELAAWLRDRNQRHQRILDVTDRDSIIEGFPPLTDEERRLILQELRVIDERRPTPVR